MESDLETTQQDNASPYGEYSFENVFSFKHLCEAALLCKRNVFWKASVQNFMRAMHYNCATIYIAFLNGLFRFQDTNEFDIRERGKERHIKSIKIRDRVVQKVLCVFCLLPLFSKSFIYDNCASVKDKGISFAFERLTTMLHKYFQKNGNIGYVLRFDFSDYFGSISHKKAIEMIATKVKDERVLKIIKDAISIYSNGEDRGVGLGSELSQFIALLYANEIDHLIKDKLRFKYYIRYMDDGVIICESKEQLKELLKEIQKVCEKLELKLNKKKTTIVPLSRGFNFLKKNIILTDRGRIIMKISSDTVTRMRRKLIKLKTKLDEGIVTMRNIEDAYTSWRSFVQQFDAYDTIQNMDAIFKEIYGYIPKSKKEKSKSRKRSNEIRFEHILEQYEEFEEYIDLVEDFLLDEE